VENHKKALGEALMAERKLNGVTLHGRQNLYEILVKSKDRRFDPH